MSEISQQAAWNVSMIIVTEKAEDTEKRAKRVGSLQSR